MPIKSSKIGNDLINNNSILDQLKTSESIEAKDDMMSDVLAEKLKMKASSAMHMVGVLTPVLYYQVVADGTNNYSTDANGPSDINYDTKKFIEIKDFRVKLSNATNFENANEEEEKSYETNGSMIILPRTIKPNVGDMFIMKYYGRNISYIVSSVETISMENDSGFECQYTIYKENYTVPEHQINSHKLYRHELVGTSYRPILTSNEYELLKKFEKVYDHMSDVFNDLFYDRDIDSYLCKNYEKEHSKVKFVDNNNINTLGKRKGVFRASYQGDCMTHANLPNVIPTEDILYDNLLNKFISSNRIFNHYNGLLLSVEPKMGEDRVGYKRSVFGCLEAKSVANYRNTFVSPMKIEILNPSINAYFVGKLNVIHGEDILPADACLNLLDKLKNSLLLVQKTTDLHTKCTNTVYQSMEVFLVETIVRYVYGVCEDFSDRFKYLYENIDKLYEHEMSYIDIYYLFPMVGYILTKTLNEMYSNNIDLTK